MKTTLNLPDDLMIKIKVHAAKQNRTLQDVVAEFLRRGLAHASSSPSPRRVQFPLIQGGHAASPDQEMTPERVAQILLEQEADEAL